jgi:quercetin dioxygenase-like cupin family protein
LKFTAIARDDVAPSDRHPVGHAAVGVRDARLLSPPGHPLWLADLALADGGGLEWGAEHGDEALYVLDGAATVDGRTCPAGGAVVVEAGVAASIVAEGNLRVAHFGAPPTLHHDGRSVHVFGPNGQWLSGRLEGVRATWFTDSTCATCRAAFFVVQSPDRFRGPPHSHSQAEIIYLIEGGVRMGARTYGPGTALSIPADVRYAFDGLEGGHRFLNFRAGTSYQTNAGAAPLLETAAAREGVYTGDLR